MTEDIQFKMRDGLTLKGTLIGNIDANDLIIMLHSGGYDRRVRGVKKVTNTTAGKEVSYYNEYGNYEYLSGCLKDDAAILLINQRNHGRSGKNIDAFKMINAIKSIDINISDNSICNLLNSLLVGNKDESKEIISKLKIKKENKELLEKLIAKPIVKDMSFLEMAQDLQEVIEQIKTEVSYTNIHLVGTCMGGLISSLYLINNPDKVKSLTLFSPLYTLDQVFLNPQNEFNKQKREVIGMGIQYKMGNAVEGPETIREIKKIRKYFYKKLFAVDIPIYCIQGIEDKLVPAEYQNKIFAIMKEYHEKNMCPVFYAEIVLGVHCLYDTLFPVLLDASEFINSNLNKKLSL